MKYRKKPVVVEAYKTDKEVVIHTLEGDMKASIGDYIVTGVNGEQYPCKPDVFEKTYEAVTNTNYDRIKAMSVEEMAVMFNEIIKCAQQKIINELVRANIAFTKCDLDDNIQIEIHKQFLEQEVSE